ncbi:hypothetical protein AAFC00_005626 [Neodothiora populina]|uniref:Guanine nucleotide exchange factor Vps9 n=1 Tax=Neodothiora populina TaxID=2781224 RepID=A0ABR3PML2_9PEZI
MQDKDVAASQPKAQTTDETAPNANKDNSNDLMDFRNEIEDTDIVTKVSPGQIEAEKSDEKNGLTQDKSERDAEGQLSTQTASLSLVGNPTSPQPDYTEKEEKSEDTISDAATMSPQPPPPPPKDDVFITRQASSFQPPLPPLTPHTDDGDDGNDDEKRALDMQTQKETSNNKESSSEIQNIIDQFDTEATMPELQKIMSPRFDAPASYPPRSSSLDPSSSNPNLPSPLSHSAGSRESYLFNPSAARPGSISGASISNVSLPVQEGVGAGTSSPRPPSVMIQPPLPSPDPEPALPFDFHRFLDQLRHRTADPVARFLRSFLTEFAKKQWMVHEQVKIISDFLDFIAKKMALCDVWRNVSDQEFDNAREGMEKLVMNRLYNQTFSPAIPPPEPLSPAKLRRPRSQSSQAPGRKGQHQEDVERDTVIAQKIRIYRWVREEHLDLAPFNEKGRKFLLLAQQELLKINSYRAPRDKVICVLNACKVIFGFLKNSKGDQSADSFLPLLIYTVLRANPEHLVSNVQYILRFRNQEKLGGEAGYYISSLMGVVSFVENLDRTNLTVTDEEFERNVEASVSAIAEGHKAEEYESTTHDPSARPDTNQGPVTPTSPTKSYQPHYSEKGAPSRPELTPRNSTEGERALRNKSARSDGSDSGDEKDAVSGLLRTIQKPLSSIGRIFSDESQPSSQSTLKSQPVSTPRLSPAPPTRPLQRNSSEESRRRRSPDHQQRARSAGASRIQVQDEQTVAASQARAEAAEAQRIQAQEHLVVVETLQGMFPDLDRDVISDVVRMKDGRVGLAVDACLALSN